MLENTASLKRSATMWILICFCLQWFGAWNLVTRSKFSPDIIRFCLTFPRGTYVLILIFPLKNDAFASFLWLLAWGGYPLEKSSKKVPKSTCLISSKMTCFRAEGGIWTPLKKHSILGHPKNSPKAALGRPKGPKHAQKGAFLMCFRYLFGVPCQQWKLCSRVGGSLS